jgi:hypothetical protein
MSDRPRSRDAFVPDSGGDTDRGVSEVISFALIFSLIAATVALVYVSGIGGLEDTRSSEQVNNAERAFDVLADNIGDIHRQAAPSRATEIKVSDAQMEFGDSVRANITIRNMKGTGNTSVVEYRPIVYSAEGGTDLLYSNGALFREDPSGAVLDKNPPFLLTYDAAAAEKTLILPVIETRNTGPESTGSQRTVLVRTLLATREVTIAQDDPETLRFNTTGDDANEFRINPDFDGDGTDEISDLDPDNDGNNEYGNLDSDGDGVNDYGDLDPDGDGSKEYNVTVRIQTSEKRSDIWLDYLEEQVTAAGGSFDARAGSGACDIIEIDGDSTTETVECSLAAENVYSTATRVDVIYR